MSVRFLGRRVYWAAVVILASALRGGLNDRRAQQLSRLIGVPKRTLERWWKNARAQFMPPVETTALPASLIEAFAVRIWRER